MADLLDATNLFVTRRLLRRPLESKPERASCICAVKDCYYNKIVGYSIDSHMRASLAVAALRNAIALRDRPVSSSTPTAEPNFDRQPTGACCALTE